VGKTLALPNGTLVVNGTDSPEENIIERHLAECHALLFGLLGLVPCLEADLLCPPMIEGGYRKNGQVVPFHWIWILGFSCWKLLEECEEVNPRSEFTQTGE
jgi:hypothetical protein